MMQAPAKAVLIRSRFSADALRSGAGDAARAGSMAVLQHHCSCQMINLQYARYPLRLHEHRRLRSGKQVGHFVSSPR